MPLLVRRYSASVTLWLWLVGQDGWMFATSLKERPEYIDHLLDQGQRSTPAIGGLVSHRIDLGIGLLACGSGCMTE